MYLSFDVFSFSLWKNPVRDIHIYICYCDDTKNPFYFDFLYIRGIINFFRKQDNEIIE